MEHYVVLIRADGSVRNFRIYGRAAPRPGEVVTLPIDGRSIKARIDKTSGAELAGSVDHVNAIEMEAA